VLIASVGRFAVRRGTAFPASVQNLQRHLAQRRIVLVNAFLSNAGALPHFWPYVSFPGAVAQHPLEVHRE